MAAKAARYSSRYPGSTVYVSRTMGFEEMCVTRLEQELCTQIFLPFVKLMKYNEI